MVAAISSSITGGVYSSSTTANTSAQAQISALEQQLAVLQQQLIKTQCVQTEKTLNQQINTIENRITNLQANSSTAANSGSGITSNLSVSANSGTTATQGNLINTLA